MYKEKLYLSRRETKFWSSELPVGDPAGGAAYGERNDAVSALIGVGGSIISGMIGSDSQQSAANTQASAAAAASQSQLAATQASIAEQQREFDSSQARSQPWITAGQNALAGLPAAANFNLPSYRPFTMQQFHESPGYQFALGAGLEQINNAASSRGMYFSPNTIKDLSSYATGMADQEWNNAFNRDLVAQQTSFNMANTTGEENFNRQASMAGVGQTAVAGVNQLGAMTSGNISNLLTQGGNASAAGIMGAGNAQAAGMIGSTNAMLGGLNSAFNTYSQMSLMNSLFGGGNMGGGGSMYSMGSYDPMGSAYGSYFDPMPSAYGSSFTVPVGGY